MSDEEVAIRILNRVFPKECKAAGSSLVSDAVAGIKVEPPAEGQPFPVMEIVEFLKDAAQFIAAAYAIYKTWKELNKSEPSIDQLKEELAKRGVKRGRLSETQEDKILQEIKRRKK